MLARPITPRFPVGPLGNQLETVRFKSRWNRQVSLRTSVDFDEDAPQSWMRQQGLPSSDDVRLQSIDINFKVRWRNQAMLLEQIIQ